VECTRPLWALAAGERLHHRLIRVRSENGRKAATALVVNAVLALELWHGNCFLSTKLSKAFTVERSQNEFQFLSITSNKLVGQFKTYGGLLKVKGL